MSQEAYDALAARKTENESFTDVILRITNNQGKASSLLKYVESLAPDEDLAKSIESSMKRTRRFKLPRVGGQDETRKLPRRESAKGTNKRAA